MGRGKKSKKVTPAPSQQTSSTARPRTLFQHLSSGFSSMMPDSPLRRGSRSETAPTQDVQPPRNPHPRSAESSTLEPLVPRLVLPRLSGPQEACSYDPNVYHSFPSIETPPCNICGLRKASSAASSVFRSTCPCRHCKTRSQFSHISFKFRPSWRSRTASVPDTASQPLNNESLPNHGSRIVTATAVADSRSARRASLPVGRVLSQNTLQPPLSQIQEQHRGQTDDYTIISITRRQRPVSPRLHHLPAVSGSRNQPYVHKREVEQHMAALSAGSPSPLRHRSREPSSSTSHQDSTTDYSRTVFYSHISATTSHSHSSTARNVPAPDRPHDTPTPADRTDSNGANVTDHSQTNGQISQLQVELESSQVYRRRTPQLPDQQPTQPPRDVEHDSFSTLTTQTPLTVGGRRLELRGGAPAGDQLPRIRGGGGDEQRTNAPDFSYGFTFKNWLLGCREYNTDSDSNSPPTREGFAGRARPFGSSYDIAPMPVEMELDLSPEAMAQRVRIAETEIAAARDMQAHSCDDALSSQPVNTTPYQSTTHVALHASETPPPSPASDHPPRPNTPIIPRLRGGAGSEHLFDNLRVPPSLYWLAGGQGRPITVSSWKKQRGKKRMDGLWGMAVHGTKAGQEWDIKTKVSESVDVKVEVKVAGSVAAHSAASSPACASPKAVSVRSSPQKLVQNDEPRGLGGPAAVETATDTEVQKNDGTDTRSRKGSVEYIEGIGLVRDV